MIAHDREQVLQGNDLPHAGDLFRLAVIDVPDLAAKYGAGQQRRELHPRRQDVDSVNRLAVDLLRRVEPLERLADQLEVGYCFELRLARRRESSRLLYQRRVRQRTPARWVDNLATLGAASIRIRPPAARRRLYQHGARTRAGCA